MTIASTFLPNGLGEPTGDELVTSSPWWMSGVVRYFDSVNGDDTNTGLERLQPLKTLQTYLNSGAPAVRDILVLADDFAELLDDDVSFLEGIVIVGAGSSSTGQPTARLSSNSATDSILDVTVDGVEFRNIVFDRVIENSTTPIISISAASEGTQIKGCRFELGSTSQFAAVYFASGTHHVLIETTFVSTQESGARPVAGLLIEGDADGLRIEDCTFDGGTAGFENGIACSIATAQAFMKIESLSLLRGADFQLPGASSGRIQDVSNVTGAGRVVFT